MLPGITNCETWCTALFSDIRKRNFIIVTVKAWAEVGVGESTDVRGVCCNSEDRNVRKMWRDKRTHTREWAETPTRVENVTEEGPMSIAKKEMSGIRNHVAVKTHAIGQRGRNMWRIFQKTVSCEHAYWRRRHARDCVGWQVCAVIRQGKYVAGRAEEGGKGDKMWRRRWRHVLSDRFGNVDLYEVQTKRNERKSV